MLVWNTCILTSSLPAKPFSTRHADLECANVDCIVHRPPLVLRHSGIILAGSIRLQKQSLVNKMRPRRRSFRRRVAASKPTQTVNVVLERIGRFECRPCIHLDSGKVSSFILLDTVNHCLEDRNYPAHLVNYTRNMSHLGAKS